MAVASGAGLLEGDDVAVGEVARVLAVHHLVVGPRIEHGATEDAGATAEQAPGWKALAVGEIRQLAVVGEEAQVPPNATAAAKAAGAARVSDELEALDDDRMPRLLHLDRD